MKSGKTMVAKRAGKGISKLCRRRGWCERSGGKVLQPVVLPDLQRKGPVRQGSLSAESVFGYFCRDKSN
jgi:hypothetical protein